MGEAPGSGLPWVEKYRPATLRDVAAHTDIIDTGARPPRPSPLPPRPPSPHPSPLSPLPSPLSRPFPAAAWAPPLAVWAPDSLRPAPLSGVSGVGTAVNRLIDEGRLPHLLFYGPPGTGKTSTILAVAKQIYGPKAAQMTLHLNASDDRGIGVVRDNIQEFASTRRLFSSGFKLVVLDECDAMTKDAQFALRRVIEKYASSTRFCLICNYVNKIIPALQSRCTRFRFSPLPREYIRERVKAIAQQEGAEVQPETVEALVALGGGDMRRTLNTMQSTCMAGGAVTEDAVYDCTGHPRPRDVATMVDCLLNKGLKEAFESVTELLQERGLALVDVVRELHPWCFKIDMPPNARMDLVERLADLEHTLAGGAHEQLQLGALVAAFTQARGQIVVAAV